MDLSLDNRSIISIDVETTGMNPAYDQIIELSILQGFAKSGLAKTWRIRPSVPISKAAYAVHGIGIDDLISCKPFADYSDVFRDMLSKSSVLVGYNVDFDIGFIQAEFRRIGQEEVDLSDTLIVDPFRLWRKFEPRSLSSAYKRFVGKDLSKAHSAEADAFAASEVLMGMIDSFGLAERSWEELAKICKPNDKNWLGPTYHIQWSDGVAVFGFGKYKNQSVVDVVNTKKSRYSAWLLERDFPEHVKEIVKAAGEKSESDFKLWIAEQFGEFASEKS